MSCIDIDEKKFNLIVKTKLETNFDLKPLKLKITFLTGQSNLSKLKKRKTIDKFLRKHNDERFCICLIRFRPTVK
jgi:hypothetical protein